MLEPDFETVCLYAKIEPNRSSSFLLTGLSNIYAYIETQHLLFMIKD